MTIDDLTLDTTQSVDIKADIGEVFRSVLHRFGEGFSKPPDGESMQMVLEQWPGGGGFATVATASAIYGDTCRSSSRPCCSN